MELVEGNANFISDHGYMYCALGGPINLPEVKGVVTNLVWNCYE